MATWYDPDDTVNVDLKAAVETDPAPQGKLNKMNEDCDDEQSPIPAMCYWNFLSVTYGSFVLLSL